jgi:epoxyqueuosine reductase
MPFKVQSTILPVSVKACGRYLEGGRLMIPGSIKYVSEGAERYVTGDVTAYDQKNEMFKRPFWDSGLKELRDRFYFNEVPPRNKSGYQLKDQALVNAAWRLEREYALGVRGGRMGMYAWDWDGRFTYPHVPPGLKIDTYDPAITTLAVKKAARLFGASLAGVCKLDRRWLYSKAFNFTAEGIREAEIDIPGSIRYAVAIAVKMDYEAIGCSPAYPASAATGTGYSQMAFTAGLLAQYIRGLGFQAIPCGNDTACSIPIAIDAGLGEMGRNGLLITPAFGPRVRLAKVLTDLPLVPDHPIEFGVWDFCMKCEKCAGKCPSKSIVFGPSSAAPHNISNRTGVNVWHINAETCLQFWAENGCDCANCIRSCPFNKPAGLWHDCVRWGIRNAPWLNKLFLWGDDVLGYGRKQNAARFWSD